MFTLSCFLTKFVSPSLIVVRYIREKVQDAEVEMFLRIVFICSMENVVCVCTASLVGKVVSKRRNGDMIELRKQRVSWDVRGIVFAVV